MIKVRIEIDRSAILFGEYFSGAALGAAIGFKIGSTSLTTWAVGWGILIFFLLPPTLLERIIHWSLVGLSGLINIALITYIFHSNGYDVITSLFIVASPFILINLISLFNNRSIGQFKINDEAYEVEASIEAAHEKTLRDLGMSEQIIPYEMAEFRLQRAKNAPKLYYIDTERGFSIRIPNGWTQNVLQPVFYESGGCLAISSPSKRATLNVSVGSLESHELEQIEVRVIRLRQILAQYSCVKITDNENITGETNVVKSHWSETDGSYAGLITAVHNDNEYVIQYRRDKNHRHEITHILDSFIFLNKWC